MTRPSGWKLGRLGAECSIEIGGTPSRDVPEYWDGSKETSNLWVSIRDLNVDEDGIASLVALTQELYSEIERELRLTGFWESIPARNKLKADIQKTLLQPEFSKLPGVIKNRAQIISRVMEIAEKNSDIILYAP